MAQHAPTLMFCLGATKAGTSWLHQHLAQHPDCHVRSLKELHYFDGLEHGRLQKQRAEVEASIERLLQKLLGADAAKSASLKARIADRKDWAAVLRHEAEDIGAYLDYLCDGAETRKLVADITPAYGLLPEERLTQMAGLLPDVRFVYLMRDPVDRLWSHVRMNTQRRTGRVDQAQAMLDQVLDGKHPDIARRSNYRAVLEKMDRAVPSDKAMALFYEDLFAPGGAERLCAFLGVAPIAADVTRRMHAGMPADLAPEAARRARAWLDDQYSYVAARFGALPAAWQAHQVET